MIDKEISNIFDRRSALFLGGVTVLTSVLILRMLQMQVFNHKSYLKQSENNSFRIQINMPPRGKILSRSGTPLSRDTPIYRIYIVPEESDDVDGLVDIIATELKLREKRVKKIREKIAKQPRFQPVLVSQNTDWSELARIQAKNLPGLRVASGYARVYEMGPAGSQFLGYVGEPAKPIAAAPFYTTGITGLEKRYNNDLAGTPGQTVMIANAVGRITGEDKSQFIAPIPGLDLQTTIHDGAQRAMYDALTDHRAGCGVAMDVETGDILAMVSTPGFDANQFTSDDGDEYIASLVTDVAKPFMNKTVEGLYPPGSTFKIVVALAALESGAISPKQTVFCPGYWDYGDRRYHCWEHKGHGHVDMAGALKHSCDIYFYQLALKIGIDAIKRMAIKLGFTEKYMGDILSREMSGIIPDKKWKEKNTGTKWVNGDTVISGIGQGFILVNCLQLATMLARVVSNRVVKPRLIMSDKKPNFAKLNLKEQNIKYVLAGLEEVTKSGGTAAGSAINVNGARMGGKTGTSQVRSISRAERQRGVLTNEQLQWHMRNHGLFVGYAPTDNPKYVVCTITEHSGGSGPAARTTAAVMRELLKDGV